MNLGPYHLDLSSPCIMAVLNATPDSFSDGGQLYGSSGCLDLSRVLKHVEGFLAEGADIIDVGGESTRPGSAIVTVDEELDRVVSIVEAIAARFDIPVSVDTSTPEVIQASASAGASMINDVRALQRDGALEAAVSADLPVCLVHMAGDPKTMQQSPRYQNVVADVSDFLLARAHACEDAGIDRCRIVVDPGFGFGKTLENNLTLFRAISDLSALGFPLLVGVSRKSMIGEILDKPVNQRLVGSVALAMLAAQQGAAILRVHDVAATVDMLKIMNAVEERKDG